MPRDPEPGPDNEGPRHVTYDLDKVEVDPNACAMSTRLLWPHEPAVLAAIPGDNTTYPDYPELTSSQDPPPSTLGPRRGPRCCYLGVDPDTCDVYRTETTPRARRAHHHSRDPATVLCLPQITAW